MVKVDLKLTVSHCEFIVILRIIRRVESHLL